MMAHQIIIYSGDVVRGHIIQKKLAWHGIQTHVFHKIIETQEAIKSISPAILIIDTVVDFERALIFFQSVAFENPFTRIIILSQGKLVAELTPMTTKKHVILSDPIHPERILTLVRNWLADLPLTQKPFMTMGKSGAIQPITVPPFFLNQKKSLFQRFRQFFRPLKQGK